MHPFSQMGWIYEKMMKSLIRPAMIFIPFATGFLLPQAAQLQWTIRWALIVMLFLACLQIRFKQLKPKAFHWRVLAANLLIGVLPYWIFHAMGPEYDQLALAAFFRDPEREIPASENVVEKTYDSGADLSGHALFYDLFSGNPWADRLLYE